MNCDDIIDIIVKFIHDIVSDAYLSKVVVGLSGGIDSSVSAALAVRALEVNNVIGIMMPRKIGGVYDSGYKDAVEFAKSLGIHYVTVPLENYLRDPPKRNFLNTEQLQNEQLLNGNIAARMRMIILYDQAARRRALVMGTTNKTELMLGYYTKYGDGGVDFEPLAGIYKTEIIRIAKHIGIPDNIVNKPPSADLWEGQTDEEELGVTYKDADKILWQLVEERNFPDDLRKNLKKLTGIEDKDILNRVHTLITKNKHKRHVPPTADVLEILCRR